MNVKPVMSSVAGKITKPVSKTAQKLIKTPKLDLSCEERGFFKYGDRIVQIIFPR